MHFNVKWYQLHSIVLNDQIIFRLRVISGWEGIEIVNLSSAALTYAIYGAQALHQAGPSNNAASATAG